MTNNELVQDQQNLTGEDLTGPWFGVPTKPSELTDSVAFTTLFRSRVRFEPLLDGGTYLQIAADSRYRLTVNGELLAAGPAKPSGGTWFADLVDLGPALVLGDNIIGIEVLSYSVSTLGNASVPRTGRPGLFVRGTIGCTDLSKPAAWKCKPVTGRRFHQGSNTLFLGSQETVNGPACEPGWFDHDFDDACWPTPLPDTLEPFSAIPRPRLAPRPIPHLTLDAVPIAKVVSSTDASLDWDALICGGGVDIPAGRDVVVDLDAGELMTAFVSLALEAGSGAALELTAAECFEQTPIDVPWLRRKGDRTDHLNGDLHGDPDRYRAAGTGTPAQTETYSPFWFRTFRYLRLRITTTDSALRIRSLDLTRTHYPLDITGSFASSSDKDARLWEVSVRTLLNCMHETFEDCPFYEQLQYAMDTRAEALFSLHLSADDRLIRRAIEDFAASGDATGLTESRSPSVEPQFIPGFSLYWVRMVADHVDHIGDRAFTERFSGRIDGVLGWFNDRLSPDGFIISPEDNGTVWNFVDWTDAWRISRGVPDLGPRRTNTIATFMYIATLRAAASIAQFCDRTGLSLEYTSRADNLTAQITSGPAWDTETRYFRDSDRGRPASLHAQVWAVLSGAVTGDKAADLLRRAASDDQLAPCSYAATLDLFDALRSAGVDDGIDWTPWEDMLAMNLTTWEEDTVSQRSDCHAWGSVPLQHFPRYVLGVRPAAPGFAAATIHPAPSDLTWARGSVPTPQGLITVQWTRTGEGRRAVTVTAPPGLGLKPADTATDITEQLDSRQRTLTFTL